MTEDVADFDIAVLGSGSGGESFVAGMHGQGRSIVVFEPHLVGGECPFVACMPSKAMLHDARSGRSWSEAVARRDELVHHFDDTQHADGLRRLDATVVRERGRVDGVGRVVAGGIAYEVDDIVLATGSRPVFPDITGLDPNHDRVWTSRDALTTTERPETLIVLGGGAIGSELAALFAGFGTAVVVLHEDVRPVEDLHPAVGHGIARALGDVGVEVLNEVEIERIDLSSDDATVHLVGGDHHVGERLLVSTGRRPSTDALGLESVGVDPEDCRTDDCGSLIGTERIWMVGDCAGRQQYTHVANHHGTVVANQISGDGTRRFGDVVTPACVFIDPPVIVVGPSYAELASDPDIVWAEVEIDPPRAATDELPEGFVAIAARRSTRCLVAADGFGPRIDELSQSLVVAIDGSVTVDRLAQSMQPFPTVGGVLADVYQRLLERLDDH